MTFLFLTILNDLHSSACTAEFCFRCGVYFSIKPFRLKRLFVFSLQYYSFLAWQTRGDSGGCCRSGRSGFCLNDQICVMLCQTNVRVAHIWFRPCDGRESDDAAAAAECISTCQTDCMCSCILMFEQKIHHNKIKSFCSLVCICTRRRLYHSC